MIVRMSTVRGRPPCLAPGNRGLISFQVFDNADFGYTRVTVERPLRLRYRMTTENKARFLDACPHLLDDVQAIDKTLGREPQRDWDEVWQRILILLHERRSSWKKPERNLFRNVFTAKGSEAEPVREEGSDGGFEPDPDLRDTENVSLKEDIDAYFKREVLPHVPDAWMDRSKDKVGYEINFNRYFNRYSPPRSLEDIDADLKKAEAETVKLLKDETERRELITSVVTRGLDPSVQLKDSGVEWLGRIPAHWGVRKLKYLVSFTGGGTPSKGNASYWTGDIPWASPKDFGPAFISDTEDHISREALDESATTIVPARSVIIVFRSGILKHTIPVAINTVPLALNQDLKALIPKSEGLDVGYLRGVIDGCQDRLLQEWRKVGATVESLELDLVANSAFPLPPWHEQLAIEALLEREAARFDAACAAAERTIGLLKERRAALISAAVTGQIDVAGSADSR